MLNAICTIELYRCVILFTSIAYQANRIRESMRYRLSIVTTGYLSITAQKYGGISELRFTLINQVYCNVRRLFGTNV